MKKNKELLTHEELAIHKINEIEKIFNYVIIHLNKVNLIHNKAKDSSDIPQKLWLSYLGILTLRCENIKEGLDALTIDIQKVLDEI
jgi:hypothetical protein